MTRNWFAHCTYNGRWIFRDIAPPCEESRLEQCSDDIINLSRKCVHVCFQISDSQSGQQPSPHRGPWIYSRLAPGKVEAAKIVAIVVHSWGLRSVNRPIYGIIDGKITCTIRSARCTRFGRRVAGDGGKLPLARDGPLPLVAC